MAKMNNLAFDYSAYDAEVLAEEKKIKHRHNTDLLKRKNSVARMLGLAFVAMTLMFFMIYGKVELSSLYEKQAQMEAELSQLVNENISLESELATKTGLSKVEEYAEKELGLQKLDKSQIEYVEIEKDTVAEVIEPENENVFVKIKNWFSNALEYIGAK